MLLAAACGGESAGPAAPSGVAGPASRLIDLGPVDQISSDNHADLAAGPDGGVLLGSFRAREGGMGHILLLALDAAGDTAWAAPDDQPGRTLAVAADPDGGWWAAMAHDGPVAFGEYAAPARPGTRSVLTHWTDGGRCDGLWPFRGEVLVTQLAAAPDATLYAAGQWSDSLGLGDEAWKPDPAGGQAFTLCLRHGRVAWSGTTTLEPRRLRADGDRLVLGGAYRGALSWRGEALTGEAPGGQEGALLVLDAEGHPALHARFGSGTQPAYGYRSMESVADLAVARDTAWVAWLAETPRPRARARLDLRVSAFALRANAEDTAWRAPAGFFTAAEDVGTVAVLDRSPEGDLLLAANVPETASAGGPPPDLRDTYQRVPALMRFGPDGSPKATRRFRNTGADPFAQFRRGVLRGDTWWLSGHARGALAGLDGSSPDDGRHHLLVLRTEWAETLAPGP